ncbi:hypothetical protein BU16DRAFT_203346 [Lophium mytilinum]|uniref:Uncharacterized protein n=1 Tax=Lophium mytilinum TaxID=390894 RepID=A0A6A6RB33_9PEZI|nr:hypothetical protein BU16DRAFT_203346 [Lophium mytilinum]
MLSRRHFQTLLQDIRYPCSLWDLLHAIYLSDLLIYFHTGSFSLIQDCTTLVPGLFISSPEFQLSPSSFFILKCVALVELRKFTCSFLSTSYSAITYGVLEFKYLCNEESLHMNQATLRDIPPCFFSAFRFTALKGCLGPLIHARAGPTSLASYLSGVFR